MQYEHEIDDIITNGIRKQGSLNPTKIHQILVRTYNPKISRTTVLGHLDDLTTENILVKSKEKCRNNEQHFSLSGCVERQLEYYGNIESIKSQRESRDRKRSKEELEDERERGENEIAENRHVIFLNLLIQAAEGSARFVPASRELLPGEMDLPVSFEREEGVTAGDIINHRDVGNAGIFRHVKFTEPMVQKCIDILGKKYGIDIEKHKHLNTYNTLEEDITRLGSESDDLIEEIEGTKTYDDPLQKQGQNETGISIKDHNLRPFINNIACLIFIIERRIKYTWMFKGKPDRNSWEFDWYTAFFGREKTLELIEKSKHMLPSLKNKIKNKEKRQKLLDYVRKNTENYWNGIGRRDIDQAIIKRNIQDEFDMTLHDKKRVGSLIRQTDKHIIRLYHEEIKCDPDQYRRIHYHKQCQNEKCEKCQRFHDEYEDYRKFVKDILVTHNNNNKSSALMVPLLKLVYPPELRKLHESQEKRKRKVQIRLVKKALFSFLILLSPWPSCQTCLRPALRSGLVVLACSPH